MTFPELNTALRWPQPYRPRSQFILVRDTLKADGAFMLHHFINSFLADNNDDDDNKKSGGIGGGGGDDETAARQQQRQERVCLVSLGHTFFHYSSIELKLNVNLRKEGENGRFRFIDALSMQSESLLMPSDLDSADQLERRANSDETLLQYMSPFAVLSRSGGGESPAASTQDIGAGSGMPSCVRQVHLQSDKSVLDSIHDAIVGCFRNEGDTEDAMPTLICLDHINPLLSMVDDRQEVYRFILRLKSLCKKHGATVVVTMHCDDDADSSNNPTIDDGTGVTSHVIADDSEDHADSQFTNMLEHLADLVFRVQGLPTGYSRDVNGVMEVVQRPQLQTASGLEPPIHTLHFKAFEHSVKFFTPGH